MQKKEIEITKTNKKRVVGLIKNNLKIGSKITYINKKLIIDNIDVSSLIK